MIICEEQTYEQSMATIKFAVSKVWSLFRREAFSFEDIVQEVLIRLLDSFPFKSPAILFIAAKRKALDFLRTLTGRNGYYKTHDRGNKPTNSKDTLDFIPDYNAQNDPNLETLDRVDYLDWCETQLAGIELDVFTRLRKGMKQEDIAKELNFTASYVSYLLNKKIIPRFNHEPEKCVHNRPSSRNVRSFTPDCESVDRQRIVERLANTR